MNNLTQELLWDETNPLLMTDGYKPSHGLMYPPKMQYMQSYFESRAGAMFDFSVFFGLQYYLKRYMCGPVLTPQRLEQAREFWTGYFGTDKVFNYEGWKRTMEKWEGHLPLRIRALPEGTVVPQGCAMLVVENTDPEFAEIVNYGAETLLSKVWYPTTVATQSREIKKIITRWVKHSGGNMDFINWMLHDFGYRGVSSEETARLGAAAHLLNFFGSDTVAGDLMLCNFYQARGLVSGSIPASEHSTVTTWGEDHEVDFLENLLRMYPQGIVANVIDSYDPQRYIMVYAAKFRDQILAREGKLVFRPDSGDPRKMVVQVLEWLGEVFGWSYNAAGYKELNPKVGIIYGDGMTFDTIDELYRAVINAGWCASNVAVGSGGGLLQKVDRDTQRFAFKACWAQVNDNPRDVYKRPSSDHTKDSKRGQLVVLPVDGLTPTIRTYSLSECKDLGLDPTGNLLTTVFENGKLLVDQSLAQIRARTAI